MAEPKAKEPPPKVKNDEEAAWLKEMSGSELIFVTGNGQEVTRGRNAFQGKTSLLNIGQWYILSGSKSVKAVVK
jgi:hypothetical protein